jgi:hypothetical protein
VIMRPLGSSCRSDLRQGAAGGLKSRPEHERDIHKPPKLRADYLAYPAVLISARGGSPLPPCCVALPTGGSRPLRNHRGQLFPRSTCAAASSPPCATALRLWGMDAPALIGVLLAVAALQKAVRSGRPLRCRQEVRRSVSARNGRHRKGEWSPATSRRRIQCQPSDM